MFDLTDEQRAIQRLAREFAEGEVKPIAEEIDREHRFPYEVVAKAGELGLMGIPYEEEHGGGGAGGGGRGDIRNGGGRGGGAADPPATAPARGAPPGAPATVPTPAAAPAPRGPPPPPPWETGKKRGDSRPALCGGRNLGFSG